MTLSTVVIEVVHLRNILSFLGMEQQGPTTIYVDSTSAKAIAERLADTKRSKTIDIRYNYVQQYIEEKVVELAYIDTGEMVADTLTKPLSRDLFEKHRKRLLGNFQFMYSWLQSAD